MKSVGKKMIFKAPALSGSHNRKWFLSSRWLLSWTPLRCEYWLVFLFLFGAAVVGLVELGTSFLRLGWRMTTISQANMKEFGLQSLFPRHSWRLQFPGWMTFSLTDQKRTSYPVVACLTADRFVALVLQRLRQSSPDMGFHVPKLHVLWQPTDKHCLEPPPVHLFYASLIQTALST